MTDLNVSISPIPTLNVNIVPTTVGLEVQSIVGGPQGEQGIPGQDGTSLIIKGTVDDPSDLPLTGNNEGDAYIVDGDLWIWDGDNWNNVGNFEGPPGQPGADGAPGQDGQDGTDGENGRNPEFQMAAGYIQWRYVGDTDWINLVPLTSITGPAGQDGNDGSNGADGTNGTDGREIELQKSATHLQWRYVGDPTWTDLVALTDLKGDQGIQGVPGNDGNDGADGQDGVGIASAVVNGSGHLILTKTDTTTIDAGNVVGPAGTDGSDGTDGAPGADGTDGREVEFQVSGGYIQWRYAGDPGWTNLISLTTITGPAGADGNDGAPGANGSDGTNGLDGKTILSGLVNPTTEGVDGDFYINVNTSTIFGPKTSGSWGVGTSLIGPPGADGDPASNIVTSVNTKIGDVVLDKTDIGLGNVDNTSDANKPISDDTQDALDLKLDISTAASTYQPLDGDLTAIAALTTNGFAKKTGTNTWAIDTNTYLTGNQTITLTGDATGSGTTSITITLSNSGVSAGTYKSVTVDAKGRVTGGTNPTTLSGYGITDAQSTLVSGTNIKTINGNSILGSGDLTISGGGGSTDDVEYLAIVYGVM